MGARFSTSPDDRIRDLRRQLKALDKEPPSVERAERLATFARAAHADRQLNMAMHTAQLCLDEDPDAPALLLAAYQPSSDTDPEDALRTWADLRDLARYVSRDDLREVATTRIRDTAVDWLREADESEARHRVRRLASMFDRAFADDIADAVG